MDTPRPVWTDEQLDKGRKHAIELFRAERMAELLDPYVEAYEDARQAVESLLELTVDLRDLLDQAVEVTTDPGMLEALRYLAGPPISEDDLKTLANVPTLNAARLRGAPEHATALVETVLAGLDHARFPWAAQSLEPTKIEREAAVVATSTLIAQRRVLTLRANESKDAQEKATAEALLSAGFTHVPARPITTFTQAPEPGEFCQESLFGNRKADLVVRLRDGRCMPIECKVSNSSTNSVKRLNNDAAVKANEWIGKFGSSQTVPAAVLAGVFKLKNLRDAQADGLTLFWAHQLDDMIAFVREAN